MSNMRKAVSSYTGSILRQQPYSPLRCLIAGEAVKRTVATGKASTARIGRGEGEQLALFCGPWSSCITRQLYHDTECVRAQRTCRWPLVFLEFFRRRL